MVEINEIADQDSLQAWLEALPRKTEAEEQQAYRWAVIIAHRAAMRVLPLAWEWGLSSAARKRGLTALPFLRSNLICGVAGNSRTPQLTNAATAAATAADTAADATDGIATDAAADAIFVAVAAASIAGVDAIFSAVIATVDASDAAISVVWGPIRKDCAALRVVEPLDHIKLWHDDPNPLADLWSTLRPEILAQGDGWRFWVDWYDKALNGEAQDWPLLTKIALIDPKDWDNPDPNHVNGIIARMVEQRRLELEAARLQSEIARLQETLRVAPGMGHNNPPDEIPVATQIQREFTVIWAGLDEAKDELARDAPDPTLLSRIAEKLRAAANAILNYCGRKADVAVDTALKWGVPLGGGYLLSNIESVQTHAQTLKSFASSLLN